MTTLFSPLQPGAITAPNRFFMAPLTRCRAGADHVPNALMAEYYAQRASAGLVIAEATMAMEGNSAFWMEPGIYSTAQVAGWKLTTDAVHAAGGRIFLQIWHGGRACHPLLNHDVQPVAPSPIAITGDEVHTPKGKQPYVIPRELRDDELPGIVAGFRKAAENAKAAGFDGVEVHGANGYLLDQFLRDGSNKRSGPYGGTVENRARLMLEVIEATCSVWDGALDRVEHVPMPVVRQDVGECRVDAALGRHRVGTGRKDFGDYGHMDIGASELECRVQTGAAGADDQGIEVSGWDWHERFTPGFLL